MISRNSIANTLVIATVFLANSAMPSFAQNTQQLQGNVTKSKGSTQTFFQKHPKIKSATIGAGVGTAAGAVTGLISGKGTMRGAAIGAGTGAGVGLIRSSETLKKHPVIKNTATGTVAGLGLGLAATRGRGKGAKIGAATGIGAAVGLGAGLLKDKLK
jgi:hypothetical protein